MSVTVDSDVMLESRYVEPFAKNIAAMASFKVAVGSRNITFSEDGTKSAVSGLMYMYLVNDSEIFKRLTPLMKFEGRSVVYCLLPVGKDC